MRRFRHPVVVLALFSLPLPGSAGAGGSGSPEVLHETEEFVYLETEPEFSFSDSGAVTVLDQIQLALSEYETLSWMLIGSEGLLDPAGLSGRDTLLVLDAASLSGFSTLGFDVQYFGFTNWTNYMRDYITWRDLEVAGLRLELLRLREVPRCSISAAESAYAALAERFERDW